MESMGVGSDTQGWIMCIVSGIACVIGANIICVDILVRLLPGKHNFRIQESSTFLACSLSLSFGVMIFSALYSMLPSAKRYLAKDDWDSRQAGALMMGCFVAGFIGIQIVSRFLHQYMPSHVVDCDHSHDDHHQGEYPERSQSHHHSIRATSSGRRGRRSIRRVSSVSAAGRPPHMTEVNGGAIESTPLLSGRAVGYDGHAHTDLSRSDTLHRTEDNAKDIHGRTLSESRRPSMLQVQKRVLSFVKDTKPNCDEFGPCFGYTDPCGGGCFKHLATTRNAPVPKKSTFTRSATASTLHRQPSAVADVSGDEDVDPASPLVSPMARLSRMQSQESAHGHPDEYDTHGHHHHNHHTHMHGSCTFDGEFSPIDEDVESGELDDDDDDDDDDQDLEGQQHHHHVPANAFLSIGLQTVIAIALHKFPEGFITFATNHASRSLGFSVFTALFVHNIAEGFAMALPLYMALGSRLKAVAWSSLLGGLSQPVGAAVALLWFKIANRSNVEIDSTAYGILFAVTAGIMTSVALQLFVESLTLNHDRNLSILFAFLGMMLLGFSNALVKD